MALVVVILLWPAVLICLPHAAVALAQPAGCSISSLDVSLDAQTCTLDEAGNLTGSFTVPMPSTSSQAQAPSACQTCTDQITVKACADANSTLCANAPFGIETNIVGATTSTSPVLTGFYEPAVTVRLAAGNPMIQLDPQHGQPGTSVKVTGSGFAIAPPTRPPPTTPLPTTPLPTTPPPASPLPTTTPQPESAPSNFLLPVVVAIGVVTALVAVVLLMRRRPPNGGPPSADVHARVSGATPRPVMRNTTGRPAGIVRVEVRRQAVEPRIERRTRR